MSQPSRLIGLLCVIVAISLCCQVYMILTFTESVREQIIAGRGPISFPLKERGFERQAADFKGVFKKEEGVVRFRHRPKVEGVLKQAKDVVGLDNRAAELEGAVEQEKESKGFKRQALSRQMLGEKEDAAHHSQYKWQRKIDESMAAGGVAGDSREVGPRGAAKLAAAQDHRLDQIEEALMNLVAEEDHDIEDFPVAIKLHCGEGEEKVQIVGDSKHQVCVDVHDILAQLAHRTASSAEFKKTTLFDLKIALIETIQQTLIWELQRQGTSKGAGPSRGGPASSLQSRDSLLRVYNSYLNDLDEKLYALVALINHPDKHPDQYLHLFMAAYDQAEDKGIGMQNGADIKDSDDRHRMEQVEEPVKRVVQFEESADLDELDRVRDHHVGEPVKQVLQSNEILSNDGDGEGDVGMGAKGEGGGLAELEWVLPPVDDVPSNLDDQNEYELDNDNNAGDGLLRSGAAKAVKSDLLLSQRLNGVVAGVPKVQGNDGRPAQLLPPNQLGSDYDSNRAIKGNKFEAQRNSREDPFSPPSNFILEKGIAEAWANPKASPDNPSLQKGVVKASQREGPSPSPDNPLSVRPRMDAAKKLSDVKRSGMQPQPGRAPQAIGNGGGVKKLPPSKNKKMTQQRKFLLPPGLYKLIGAQSPPFSSLRERGFAEHYHFNSSDLRDRRKYVQEVVDALEPSRKGQAVHSLDLDLLERAKFQRHRTDQFCGQNRLSKALPSRMEQLDSLFKHLLYDDSKKIVVCYVPKNGCSNLKRMMLILNGLLAPSAGLDPKRPSEELLGSVHSFRNLTREQAMYKLKNYYKFAITRNPLERLLSAYKNKLETPLDTKLRKKFPDRLKAYILDLYDHQRLKSWVSAKNYSRDIHPTFQQLIKFMTQFSLTSYNEHFMPFLQLCFPCAIDYDVVVNFKTLNYDMYSLMSYLDIPPSYYPAAIGHALQPTSVYMKSYYKRVPHQIKAGLFHKLRQELDYYYTLHPEEEGMHKHL